MFQLFPADGQLPASVRKPDGHERLARAAVDVGRLGKRRAV